MFRCSKQVPTSELLVLAFVRYPSAFLHRLDMAGIEWDDLRYILAVASAGSLAGAARHLGVNHTTVLRRVGAFETRLGLRLFERMPTGYVQPAGGDGHTAAGRPM